MGCLERVQDIDVKSFPLARGNLVSQFDVLMLMFLLHFSLLTNPYVGLPSSNGLIL